MVAHVRDAGAALRTVAGIKMRDAGAVLRTVKLGKIRDAGGALKTFFSLGALNVTPGIAEIGQSKGSTGAAKAFSLAHTLTVVSGGGGYTFAWSYNSGYGTGIAGAPTNAATITFTQTLAPGITSNALWQCVVTDALGASFTCYVEITFTCVDNS